jgi:hypothetical protein
MNRHVRVWWLVCICMVALMISAAARMQQPTADYYDTKKTVMIKGTLRLIVGLPPPTPMIIGVEVAGANSQKEMWVITGNPMTTLRRDGWQLIGPAQAIKGGDEIAITAYLPRDTQKAAKVLSASVQMPSPDGKPSGPPGFIADVQAKRARLAYGLEITKADGQKLRFGDVP